MVCRPPPRRIVRTRREFRRVDGLGSFAALAFPFEATISRHGWPNLENVAAWPLLLMLILSTFQVVRDAAMKNLVPVLEMVAICVSGCLPTGHHCLRGFGDHAQSLILGSTTQIVKEVLEPHPPNVLLAPIVPLRGQVRRFAVHPTLRVGHRRRSGQFSAPEARPMQHPGPSSCTPPPKEVPSDFRGDLLALPPEAILALPEFPPLHAEHGSDPPYPGVRSFLALFVFRVVAPHHP